MSEEKKQEKNKTELAKELGKTLMELEQTEKVEQMIQDNKIIFKVGEVNYRVRRPTPAEQIEVENFRRKKYLELVNDDSYLFRKQWIEKYKKKDIDILKMEVDIITLQSEIENLQVRLAQINNKVEVDKLKKEIIELKARQQEINIEKTDLLSCSIEDQLVVSVNSYYTYTVLEKQNNKKEWIRAFDNYTFFMNCEDSRLLNKAFYFIHFIMYGDFLSE